MLVLVLMLVFKNVDYLKNTEVCLGKYFKRVAEHTRQLDPSRPVTLVINAQWDQDLASQHFDVIAINRYFAWYSDPGHTEVIQRKMFSELESWRKARGKPVMVTEYGADTVESH